MATRRGLFKTKSRHSPAELLTRYQPGHTRSAGRPKGAVNKLPATLKEAIWTAIGLVGENGKGKEAQVGYLKFLAKEEPALIVRLLEKMMPTQVTGKNDGPVQLQALPPEALMSVPDDQLRVVQEVYERIESTVSPDQDLGDATAWESSLNQAIIEPTEIILPPKKKPNGATH